MKLDAKKTAVLTLDIQEGILGFAPHAQTAIPNAAQVVEAARRGGFLLIHVALGFELLDYQRVVVKDARFDSDEEMHQVLTEKVFTAQATVITPDVFLSDYAGT
jgi:nicotinamidase-related amidase